MIIETKDDVVRLSGSLHRNQWLTIKAAANLLLQDHPEGIIVDCSLLEDISGDGAKTFLEAVRDIEAAKARIIVASLPHQVLAVCRTIPGVRSQLPIAETVEDARASLRSVGKSERAPEQGAKERRETVILVPLLAGLDMRYGVHLAGRLAGDGKSEIRLVYFVEVGRTLPLNAPLLEEEEEANLQLAGALERAKPCHAPVWSHLERVRDAVEGIISFAKTHNVALIILGVGASVWESDESERFARVMDALMKRAPCEVIVGRKGA